MKRVTANIGDISDSVEAEFALDRNVPDVGFGLGRLLIDISREGRIGATADCCAVRIVRATAGDRNDLLQRREATKKDVVRGALTAGGGAEAGGPNGFSVNSQGGAAPPREEELLNIDIATR